MAEVWFRNPDRWMRQLVDAGANKVVWHRGVLIKHAIEPVAHARLHFQAGDPFRILSVGAQGAVEWDETSVNQHDPKACYPIWQYGESFDILEDLCANDVALDPALRDDPITEPQYRPKEGQEHRVMVGSYPNLNSGTGRRLLVLLAQLQDDYPDCIIHLFSATTFRSVFGSGLAAGDIDVWGPAVGGRAMLPNGRFVNREKLVGHRQWVNLLGYSTADLGSKEEMLNYNIASALHAQQNWSREAAFSTVSRRGDPDSLLPVPVAPGRRNPYLGTALPGDKVACNSCSRADSCKYYREGSVCTVPSSETSGLAHFFKTRDSERIIDGLGNLLATQARRAETALEIEEEAGELDPEVSRILTQMFDGGVKLAKLVNPALAAAGAPKIGIQVNAPGGSAIVSAANPAALMGALVRELEARGVPRDEITPEMVVGLVDQPNVIEAELVER